MTIRATTTTRARSARGQAMQTDTGAFERDEHGLARYAMIPGVLLERHDDPRHRDQPWMLRLTDGRHMRLNTLELDKIAYVIALLQDADEPRTAAESA